MTKVFAYKITNSWHRKVDKANFPAQIKGGKERNFYAHEEVITQRKSETAAICVEVT